MSMHRFAIIIGFLGGILGFALSGAAFAAESPNLGEPISEADLAPWDINIMPDGTGLPVGSGTATEGAPIFVQKCAICHGAQGEGGEARALNAGPPAATLDGGKSIANFWPYATTVFDFIRRAMPPTAPNTLPAEEVYALTAYVLYLNEIIGENDVIDKDTLPEVRLPNRDNFIIRFPERI
jgi:S-disulfanyl-L-cysteine oxidoreductase SoxD